MLSAVIVQNRNVCKTAIKLEVQNRVNFHIGSYLLKKPFEKTSNHLSPTHKVLPTPHVLRTLEMPRLKVPLIHPNHETQITLSYRTHGHGIYPVLLLPGLLVPSSMYDIIAAILASNPSFTIITLDNRGIGRSSTPSALHLSSGYTVTNLAYDAWAVLDHVITTKRLSHSVGLIGHSMGGMIAQQMAYLRPRAVRFLGLLATHAGGVRNLLPSLGMLVAGCRLLYNGFDEAVHADINLRLHFTERFLEEVVGGKLKMEDEDSGNGDAERILEDRENSAYTTPPPSPQDPSPQDPSFSSPNLTTPTETPIESENSGLVRTSSGTDLRFLQSKVHQFTHEAGLHFNLSPEHLTRTLREQHKQLIRRLKTLSQTTRREVYHAQYTTPSDGGGSLLDGAIGHARVVWSHSLPWSFARGLRECQRVVKLVVLGRHDRVVTPDASRRLARLIDATTVVEVDAAHFVTDECAAEVTTQLLFGLRTAFFSGRRCDCCWCVEEGKDGCRMC